MWPHILTMILGVWLIASPPVLGYGPPASISDRIVGPSVAAMGLIAVWQVTRGLRWLNVALGLWVALAPWVLGYELPAALNGLATGLLITALSLVRGRADMRTGGGWSSLWRKDAEWV